jgi:hypothetical protein
VPPYFWRNKKRSDKTAKAFQAQKESIKKDSYCLAFVVQGRNAQPYSGYK